MSDLEIARALLYKKVNNVLDFNVLHPVNIIHIIKDFLASGCKCRSDYEAMVSYVFKNDCYNREMLLK